jgi:hypothetical protein
MYLAAFAKADRDTNENLEVAVQKSAGFAEANLTAERRHHHVHHHRDRRMLQMQQADDQPPPRDDGMLNGYPPAHVPSSHAHSHREPRSLHGSERDYAQSPFELDSRMIDDVPQEESVDGEPHAYGREQEGLQMFSRSRGKENEAPLAEVEDRNRAQQDAAAAKMMDENEDVPKSERLPELQSLAQEKNIEDVLSRAEGQKKKASASEGSGFVHLAQQSPPPSSDAPQTLHEIVPTRPRIAPHFGSIDLNGDGFIDGLEFQQAKDRGDLR